MGTSTLSLHRRARRVPSAITGTLILLSSFLPSAMAQQTRYTDIPAGAYYEAAASALVDIGALDANETRLRPSDLATRAELVKLLVNLTDETLLYPSTSSFNDVARSTWYAPYFEAAASAGWIHGDNNCYQRSRPCTARPGDRVNRAEAAALLMRAFALEHTGDAPQFPDNEQNQWYYMPIQTVADHCVLQGDSTTGRVRPAALMNRAEMVVMFHRAYLNMEYGVDCGEISAKISTVSALSSTRVRVTFDADLNEVRAEDENRYDISRVSGGGTVGVDTATLVSNRIVDLELSDSLSSGTAYTFTVSNLLTSGGVIFTDNERLTFETSGAGAIASASAVTAQRIRVIFDTDVNAARAQDKSRYVVARVGGAGNIAVTNATRIDSRTVDLDLNGSLTTGASYLVSAQNMQTSGGAVFNDSITFVFATTPGTGRLTNVQALSATSIRLTFDTELDGIRAEQSSRYSVSDGSRNLFIRTANLTGDNRTVELDLIEGMTTQRSYTVNVLSMQTAGGSLFSDTGTVVFDSGSALSLRSTLTGTQEAPIVLTTARGSGTFLLTSNGLHYDILVQGMSGSITAAHFHLGETGVSGAVVQPITFSNNRATGDWTGLTDALRNAISDGRIYVNVHTAAHPDGEIRGQVLKQ